METMEEYKEFLSAVRKTTGLDMLVPDDAGLVTIRVDDQYNLNLQFVSSSGMILCFVEVASLAKDAPKAVYRELLAGALFGQETGGGYFSLEPESETVIYNYFFDGKEAENNPEDFVLTLEKILQVCDMWAHRIITLSAGSSDQQNAGSSNVQLFA
ncbi:MAG: type III secretion system chaperone [Mailhella sp.]|nr:type III secretion system chaperone [Mailhella sp.]